MPLDAFRHNILFLSVKRQLHLQAGSSFSYESLDDSLLYYITNDFIHGSHEYWCLTLFLSLIRFFCNKNRSSNIFFLNLVKSSQILLMVDLPKSVDYGSMKLKVKITTGSNNLEKHLFAAKKLHAILSQIFKSSSWGNPEMIITFWG